MYAQCSSGNDSDAFSPKWVANTIQASGWESSFSVSEVAYYHTTWQRLYSQLVGKNYVAEVF